MTEVRIVHTRTIDAVPEVVGRLLDGLGQDGDELWPADRWPPDMRVRFATPLHRGVAGGHGSIHYTVVEYERGRRLWLRFDDPGLVGHHGFDVVPTDDGRTDLVHTLEGRLEGPTRLAWPAIRPFHDAYVEDILDRAELVATGALQRPARPPRWLRTWNRFDRWRQRIVPSPRLTRTSAVAVTGLLAAVAAVHGAWALGWRWPGGNDQAWADRVGGPGADVPSAAATWGVAALLVVAAGAVGLTATGDKAVPRTMTWGVAGVLGLRGVAGVVTDFTNGFDDVYEHLDLAIYSPLCLGLAAGAAVVAQRSYVRSRVGWTEGAADVQRLTAVESGPRQRSVPIRL